MVKSCKTREVAKNIAKIGKSRDGRSRGVGCPPRPWCTSHEWVCDQLTHKLCTAFKNSMGGDRQKFSQPSRPHHNSEIPLECSIVVTELDLGRERSYFMGIGKTLSRHDKIR